MQNFKCAVSLIPSPFSKYLIKKITVCAHSYKITATVPTSGHSRSRWWADEAGRAQRGKHLLRKTMSCLGSRGKGADEFGARARETFDWAYQCSYGFLSPSSSPPCWHQLAVWTRQPPQLKPVVSPASLILFKYSTQRAIPYTIVTCWDWQLFLFIQTLFVNIPTGVWGKSNT